MTEWHDIEAERAVLGALMLDADAGDVAVVYETLEPDAFRNVSHGRVFQGAKELYREGINVETVSLVEKLERDGVLGRVGGASAVVQLTTGIASTVNLLHYADLVRAKWQRRRGLALLDKTRVSLEDPERDVATVFQELLRGAALLGDSTSHGAVKSARTVMVQLWKELELDYQNKVVAKGLTTGYAELDDMFVGGWQKTETTVIAGRPSSGKTTLGLDAAITASLLGPVLVFSLEMSARALMMRLLASRAGVDLRLLRAPGRLEQKDWLKLAKAAGTATDNLQICDDTSVDIYDIHAKARSQKARMGLTLMLVDYIQLVDASASRHQRTRDREVAEVSRGLKSIAMELDIPVIALSQLNRGAAGRPNKRPELSDLRDSGAVEQDADNVVFVHRESQHNPKAPKDRAEVIVAKQRNGSTGTIEMGWEGRFTRFRSLTGGQRELV